MKQEVKTEMASTGFTAIELGLINFALRFTAVTQQGRTADGQTVDIPKGREYESLKELPVAIDISEKLDKCTDKEKKMYIDSDVAFTTEEKVKLLEYLKRPWSLEQGKIYLSVKAKLE